MYLLPRPLPPRCWSIPVPSGSDDRPTTCGMLVSDLHAMGFTEVVTRMGLGVNDLAGASVHRPPDSSVHALWYHPAGVLVGYSSSLFGVNRLADGSWPPASEWRLGSCTVEAEIDLGTVSPAARSSVKGGGWTSHVVQLDGTTRCLMSRHTDRLPELRGMLQQMQAMGRLVHFSEWADEHAASLSPDWHFSWPHEPSLFGKTRSELELLFQEELQKSQEAFLGQTGDLLRGVFAPKPWDRSWMHVEGGLDYLADVLRSGQIRFPGTRQLRELKSWARAGLPVDQGGFSEAEWDRFKQKVFETPNGPCGANPALFLLHASLANGLAARRLGELIDQAPPSILQGWVNGIDRAGWSFGLYLLDLTVASLDARYTPAHESPVWFSFAQRVLHRIAERLSPLACTAVTPTRSALGVLLQRGDHLKRLPDRRRDAALDRFFDLLARMKSLGIEVGGDVRWQERQERDHDPRGPCRVSRHAAHILEASVWPPERAEAWGFLRARLVAEGLQAAVNQAESPPPAFRRCRM